MIVVVESEALFEFHVPYSTKNYQIMKGFKGVYWDPKSKSWKGDKEKLSVETIETVFKAHECLYEIMPYIEISVKEPWFSEKDCHLTKAGETHLERCASYLSLKGYSAKTKKNYLSHLKRFFYYCQTYENGAFPDEELLKKYILFSLDQKECSHSYMSQMISAYKLFSTAFGSHTSLDEIPRPKRTDHLPKVLSQQEMVKLLTSLENIKHKAILYLIYAAGLRVSEAAKMKISDIESDRMMIRVEQGKGAKDRYTLLSETALTLLRDYVKRYRPKVWLFEGQQPGTHLSERSIQHIFKSALKEAGINKRVSVHVLRHSFATHLLESGTDIRYIQELLGHKSPKTTQIYTHVTDKRLSKIRSPLDQIMLDEKS